MRIISIIEDREVIKTILKHLGMENGKIDHYRWHHWIPHHSEVNPLYSHHS